MKWLRVDEHGFDYCHLLPEPGVSARMIVAAVAAASFNSAWPEGYGWEEWDPMVDVTMDNVRTIFPGIFRRRRMGQKDEVLAMDYVGGRRCKTYIYREACGEHRGQLKVSAGEYEATRGDVERLLRVANELLRHRARPSRA